MANKPPVSDAPPEVVSVEIYEESDWKQSERRLGTFYLSIDRGPDGPERQHDLGPDFEAIDEDAYWDDDADDYDWPALEARQEELYAAAELEAQADPDRRLTIDEAIARAHTYVDQATIWLENTPWVTHGPLRGRQQLWPPDDLDLRPRWEYEPPDSSRSPGWWVTVNIEAEGLTEELALDAARSVPKILHARRSPAHAAAPLEARKVNKRRRPSLAIDYLVAASDDESASDADELMDALHARFPPPTPRPPRLLRLRMLGRWLRRPGRRFGYVYSAEGVGVSWSFPWPADHTEIQAARDGTI